MHQIEQPLQQVSPTPVDNIPPELSDPRFEQSAFLTCQSGEQVQCAIGAYPGFPEAEAHRQEIAALGNGNLAVVYRTDRDQVLELLEQGGRHLFYFYCHGVVKDGVFKLKLGPAAHPSYLSTASLDVFAIKWPEQPHPLVILNGCETMSLTPELIHGFLGKLRRLGASGVVGSEIQVWTQLARPFGLRLIQELLAGHSLGEAFLATRRYLLRQGNPLGLAYTNYTPANLHLHTGEGCTWCMAHRDSKVEKEG